MKKKETSVKISYKEIVGFSDVYTKLEQKVMLSSQSRSTFTNYSYKLAHLCFHFYAQPQEMSDNQINEYLTELARGSKTPSRSVFKYPIYGPRYYFMFMGISN